MWNLIYFLDHWQTLIGAAIGGFIGLLAALIVAHSANRREQKAAAMLLVVDLSSIKGAGEALKRAAQEQNIASAKYDLWIAVQLMSTFPDLSILYELSLARIMDINTELAAHLSLFKILHKHIEDGLKRLRDDAAALRASKTETRKNDPIHSILLSSEERERIIKMIAKFFQQMENHANCAEELIRHLILSPFRNIHRIRRLLFSKPKEKECKNLLKTGH